jgi:hypothetical protein
VQEKRRRYEEVQQLPAAQTSPSPHRPNAALAATIRGWAGGISLTADVGLTAAISRQDSWASSAKKIRRPEKKFGRKPATPQIIRKSAVKKF